MSGESVLAIGGLRVGEWQTPEEVMANSAGQLFVQAAQRVQPDYQLHAANVPSVTQICRLVQGMPLAILLAASWADMLSPAEIAAEITNSLDFLETELRDIPERQRSIRAVFEGSWEKLDEAERELFKRLSVFRGGFTRDAGQKAAGAGLRSLAKLVNKSFLLRDPDTGRYAVHELLRQYAAERLEARPGSAAAVRDNHAAYFSALLEKMWDSLRSKQQRQALAEIEADIENVRAAWRHLATQGSAQEMGKMIEALWYFHEIRGWYHSGVDLFSAAEVTLRSSSSDSEGDVVLTQLQAIRGLFTTFLGSPQQGLELNEASLAILQKHNLQRERLLPLMGWGISNIFLNRREAGFQAAQETRKIATDLGDEWWVTISLNALGSNSMAAGLFADARHYAELAMSSWEKIGDSWGVIFPTIVLAGLDVREGNYGQARERYQFIAKSAQSINFRRGLQFTYNSLGNVSFLLKEFQEAEDYYTQSLDISDETGQTREMLITLYDVARVRAVTGRPEEALEIVAVILSHPAIYQHILFKQTTIEEDAKALRGELESRLDPEKYAAAWQRGMERELQSVVDEVLAAGFRQNG